REQPGDRSFDKGPRPSAFKAKPVDGRKPRYHARNAVSQTEAVRDTRVHWAYRAPRKPSSSLLCKSVQMTHDELNQSYGGGVRKPLDRIHAHPNESLY